MDSGQSFDIVQQGVGKVLPHAVCHTVCHHADMNN